jgi:hypothetical protein
MIRCAEVLSVTLTPEVRATPINSLRFDAVGQGLLPNPLSNVLIECSIVNPLKSDYVNAASKKPFYACQEVCKNKKAKYHQVISEGDVFLPCIFEAFGASVPNGVSALLDSLSARCKHRPPPDATRYAPSFKLGPINKSHPHYGYPMPVIVYVLPVSYVPTTMLYLRILRMLLLLMMIYLLLFPPWFLTPKSSLLLKNLLPLPYPLPLPCPHPPLPCPLPPPCPYLPLSCPLPLPCPYLPLPCLPLQFSDLSSYYSVLFFVMFITFKLHPLFSLLANSTWLDLK